jgi:signal peptidase I
MDENQQNQPSHDPNSYPTSSPTNPTPQEPAQNTSLSPDATQSMSREEAMKLVNQPVIDQNKTSQTKGSGLLVAISAIFFGILNWVIIPVIIVFVLHNFVFQAFHVVGSSMVPTLNDTDYIIVSKIGKTISGFENRAYTPNRYDVVVFRYPKDPSLIFVKRVIGLPGDRVVVKDNHVTVYNTDNPQGINPDTNLYQRSADTTQGTFDDIVPQGSIFVLGDNRTPSGSFDSRDWGFLPSSYIVGTAAVRLLPLDQFRLFSALPTQLPLQLRESFFQL